MTPKSLKLQCQKPEALNPRHRPQEAPGQFAHLPRRASMHPFLRKRQACLIEVRRVRLQLDEATGQQLMHG